MIARLRGKLAEREPGRIVVDANGVGYEVFIALPTFSSLPAPDSEVTLDIYTHVREDAIALYGFATRRERWIFERLLGISGIGPRLAITILSGGSVNDLVTAIRGNDLGRLTAIPGVGKKTAERVVLELKDKLKEVSEAPEKSPIEADVTSALENLGYNRALIEAAVLRASHGDREATFDGLFKRALRILTKG